jgi:uncharacterized protein YgiM (DUF1202 family)
MNKRLIALACVLGVVVLLSMTINMTAAQTFGTNWTGQYYNCTNFACTVSQSRVDAAINFNWGDGSPFPGVIGNDNFSVRWTGIQTFTQTGDYQFTAAFDDTLRVYLDGVMIIDSATPATISQTVSVTAGSHTMIVEYNELSSGAFVQLQWTFVGAAATAGPSPTPGPTNTPAPTGLPPIAPGSITATVIRAGVLNVRDAPSLGGNVIGRILRGQTYAIVGRNPQATWFLVQLSGKQGWVWGYYIYVNGNEFNPPIVSGATTLGLAGATDYGVVAQAQAGMRLRAQPSVASTQTGRITWGAFLPVVGRTADGFWWKVVWKDTIGWVYSPYMKIFQGDINVVPVE